MMETKHMLNLIDFEKHRLELFRQQTDTLDGLMPMFRVAANLILEEMEPFRKYGRDNYLVCKWLWFLPISANVILEWF